MRIVQESAGTYTFWGRMPPWRGGSLLLVSGHPFTYDGNFYGTSTPVVPATNILANGQNAGGAFIDVPGFQLFSTNYKPGVEDVTGLFDRFLQKPWVSGWFNGNPVSVGSNNDGQKLFSVSRSSTGTYVVSWTGAHPKGTQYTVIAVMPSATGFLAWDRASTSVTLKAYTNAGLFQDPLEIDFMIL
jgi:hypothetical protein